MESNNILHHKQRSQLLETMYTTIQTLSWETQKQSTSVFEKFDLTVPQGIVLLTLDSFGSKAKMSDLTKLIQIPGGTMTGIVDRLIVAGLVARERDEADRRVVHVFLTEAGHRKIQAFERYQKIQLDLATADFSNKEFEQFNSLLARFVQAIVRVPEAAQDHSDQSHQSGLTLADTPS